ncbi:hypothetical protein MNEG_15060, partial [Monoraphidium neglectum]
EAASAHAVAAGPSPAHTLYSTTGPEQAASIQIFKRLGWHLRGCVELWPPSSALGQFEKKIGWPATQASFDKTGSMVEMMPGAAELLARRAAPPGAWRRCEGVRELAAALESVRRRQRRWWRAHGAGKSAAAGDGDGGDAPLPDWLPWVYDVFGARSSDCKEIFDGSWAGAEVWLLPAGAADAPRAGEDNGEWDAVVLLAPSKLFRRQAMGAVVARPDLIAPCVARAAEGSPHFVCFIDQGARYWGAPAEGADTTAWPELYRHVAAPLFCYYVLNKPASEIAVPVSALSSHL